MENQQDCINCAHGQLLPGELSAATLTVTPTAHYSGTIPAIATTSLATFGRVDSDEHKRLLSLNNAGTAAVYGDVATLTTRQDHNVRKYFNTLTSFYTYPVNLDHYA
jgi:predicted transcriptional regulator